MYTVKSILRRLTVFVMFAIIFCGNAYAVDVESPVTLLKQTSSQVIKILVDEQQELKHNPDRVYEIVDKYILPHLDDITMAKLALGKNWRIATRQQKVAFVKAFRNILVRTYSKSLLQFKGQKIKFFPVTLRKDTTIISVRAEVIQPGAPPIPLAYRMRKKDNIWKVYDIKVDGISLVTSYRGTFTQRVRESGIDGLLKYLHERNNQLNAESSS